MATFESYERRIGKIQPVLDQYGFATLDEANEYCLSKGIDVASIVKGVQPIAFENASWAYTLGCERARSGLRSRSGSTAWKCVKYIR